MKLVTIVVPVYHNAKSLRDVLTRFQQVADGEPEDFEFIFVDDGSRDDSFRVLEELARRDSRVRAVKLVRNFGSNAASSAGIAHAQGDAVVAISADLQDPPELIGDMLAHWRMGSKIVLAARADREDPWLTKVTSNIFWRLIRRFGLPNMPKHGCDYLLIDRVVLDALRHTHEPNAGIGMVLWTGYEPAIVYYKREKREAHYGRSGWSFSKRITYLIDFFVSFSHMPIRAASLLGIGLAFLGFIYACLIVASRLLYGSESELARGWYSMIVILLIVSGVQLLMLGVVGEYLVRGLEGIRRRPPYLIERVVDGSDEPDNEPEPTDLAAVARPSEQPADRIEQQL